MAEVVKFPGTTVLPLSVRTVLDAAPDDLGIALVVGKAADDTLYLADDQRSGRGHAASRAGQGFHAQDG